MESMTCNEVQRNEDTEQHSSNNKVVSQVNQ
jgi:hypothetical protein